MSHREAKIIAAVTCSECGARPGQPCHLPQRGRPQVHPARKAAWQAERRPSDYVIQPRAEGPPGQRTHYMLVAPQSPEALQALRTMRPEGIWLAGALRVAYADMPALTRALIAAGWTTGEESA